MAATAPMIFTPRPWGPVVMHHIFEHKRCAVWSPMGSGKTANVLSSLEALDLSGDEVFPALALGPLRVARKVWREESQKWEHTRQLSVTQIVGNAETRGAIVDWIGRPNEKPHDIYTLNYELVAWLRDHLKGRMPFRTIISDESRRLKAFRLKQGGVMTQALHELAWHEFVERFIELTGTPSPNGLRDLWGQLHFIDHGERLGRSYNAFETRWFGWKRVTDALNPGKTHVQAVIQKGADAEIHELVKDVCLSIDLADYGVKLDKPIFTPIFVELPIPARALYDKMERDLFIKIDQHEIEAFSAGAKTMKLLQLANGAAYLDPLVENEEDPRARAWRATHDAKIEALESIVEEVGELPIIVAYQFKSDLARLLKAFPEARHLNTERDEDDFKAGKVPMLLAHPKSAGHGIDGFQNVTNVIVFFGHSWDLELRQQIIERIGPARQMQAGLKRHVYVYDIIAEGTIDEVVLARHESKRSVQDLLLEAVKRKSKGEKWALPLPALD
jgi:SNF2 family DNA or RNA helicase